MAKLPLKYRILYFLAQYLGPVLVGMIARTMRVRVVGAEHRRAAEDQGHFIIAALHGRMFLPVWGYRHSGITALVSQSRDGETVTRLVMGLGYGTVRGSSHRGALSAVRGLLNTLKQGPIAILVDGPKGPREEPKIGTIAVARASGRPILPMVGASHPAIEFHSWDRFQLPKPFSRGILIFGEPYIIPRDVKSEELEEWRLDLKRRLVGLREEADRLLQEGR